MSENETLYDVVLSNAGNPKARDRIRIYSRDPRSLVLQVLTANEDPGDKAELHPASSLGDGTEHFSGPSAFGYQIDLTFHSNHLGRTFIYGRTGPPGRGGTGVWVAEEEEAGRGDGDEKLKKPEKK
jgi:hypothetical protein